MSLSILLYAFLIYLAYRLVFGFIIPVYRTTKKVKRGFREMQQKMQQHAEQYQQQQQPRQSVTPGPTNRAGDYIDFEEVK